MKKVLLASIIIFIILSTVFQVNALSVQKQEAINKETSDTYELLVYVIDSDWWPDLIGVIPFAKIVVTHEDDPNFRRVGFSFLPYTAAVFQIPNHLEYPTVNAYKPGWKQVDVQWNTKKEVDIIMSHTGNTRTVNYPFINKFPLFNLLLKQVLN